MITRILFSGLAAGVLAGICVAGIQSVTTTPLILKAEVYETAAEAHTHAATQTRGEARVELVHAAGGTPAPGPGRDGVTANDPHQAHDAHAWEPEDGLERTLFTTTATIGAAVGFALMLLAVMLVLEVPISASTAVLFGAAGFIVTGLAPGLGLAPELPGSVAADLVSRQVWWVATAAATATGLWSIWRWRSAGPALGGIALMVIPHVWGAPQPAQYASTVPAELAAHFTSSSLAVQAILWALVGTFTGLIWTRVGAAANHA